MYDSFYRRNKPIIYISSIILFSITLIRAYSYKNFLSKITINDGFKSAISVKNDKNICVGNKQNINCQVDLIRELKGIKNNYLFLGNSQTGAINNFEKGDLNYIAILNNYFKKTLDKNSFKSIWLPNANLNEFKYIIDGLVKCGVNIEILFIPLFLDDTRNDSIREEILHFQKDFCKSKDNLSDKLVIEKKGNLQILNKKIKNNLKFFAYLQSLNEKFRVDIYKLRNLVFNIKPSSIRSIRKASYESNINSLKKIIFERNENKLKTIVYIPPLLNANGYGPIPYSLTQYNFFKNTINNLCKNEICIYLNLEKSVPNNLWGLKESTSFNKNVDELDFMHFTGDGHSILANEFIEIIEEIK